MESSSSENPAFDYEASLPIFRGVVRSWDHIETIWRSTIEELGMNLIDSPSVFLVESIKPGPTDRKQYAEMLFETFHLPSICVANSAPLSLYASGRTTGLVVECGAGLTSSTPIFEVNIKTVDKLLIINESIEILF